MSLACNHFAIDPKAHEAIAPLTGNQVPILLESHLAISIVMRIGMIFLEEKGIKSYEEMNSGTVITKKSV